MTSLIDDYTKGVLRQLVLEHRTELRRARTDAQKAAKQYSDAMEYYTLWSERIANLQRACGDSVEIDPTYPDPPQLSKPEPLKGDIEDQMFSPFTGSPI